MKTFINNKINKSSHVRPIFQSILVVSIWSIICLNGCSDSLVPNQSEKDSRPLKVVARVDFPHTSISQLIDLENEQPDLICFSKARLVATYELQVGGYQLLNRLRTGSVNIRGGSRSGAESEVTPSNENPQQPLLFSLTDFPRVIYNYDGSVKYYEFGLIEENEVTATITVHATREAPHIIAYMFPYVLPYNHTGDDYYVGFYPERFYNDGVGYRPIVDGDYVNPYIDVDSAALWNLLIGQMDSEDITYIETMQQHALTEQIEAQVEISDYWNNVESAIDDIANAYHEDPCDTNHTPTEIENTYIQHLKDVLGTEENCIDYTALPYRGTELQQTFWTGACGPSALAWIYRGLYETYPCDNGEYLPLHGFGNRQYFSDFTSFAYYDYELGDLDTLCGFACSQVRQEYVHRSAEVDNGLTGCFYSRTDPAKLFGRWWFIMPPTRLDNALEEATGGAYTVSWDKTARYTAKWIQYHDLPVLILNTGLSHYVVAYGYGAIANNNDIDNIDRSNLYFLVTDNGYNIRNYHYKPYWRGYKCCEYYHCVERVE